MAVLGKIRSRGMILIGIIGLGLLAFIAEEAFRSCEATMARKSAFKNFKEWWTNTLKLSKCNKDKKT